MLNSSDFFNDSYALIGGSSDGLGFASAYELSKQGVKVVLTGRNEDKLKVAMSKLNGNGHRYHVVDFSNSKSLNNLLDFINHSKFNISILVNNTGGPPPKELLKVEVDDFSTAIQSHLFSAHLLSKAVIPNMKKSGFGRILNILSVTAKVPIENLGVSNTVRGAMLNWSKTLASEVAKHSITVNNLLPGYTLTKRLSDLSEKLSIEKSVSADDIKNDWISEIPLGKLGTPEEFGKLVAFLASKQSSFITGTSIPIDGGWTRGV